MWLVPHQVAEKLDGLNLVKLEQLSIDLRLVIAVRPLVDAELVENSLVMVAVVWLGLVPLGDYGTAVTLVGSVLLVTAV